MLHERSCSMSKVAKRAGSRSWHQPPAHTSGPVRGHRLASQQVYFLMPIKGLIFQKNKSSAVLYQNRAAHLTHQVATR
jgi:hypothetical protein